MTVLSAPASRLIAAAWPAAISFPRIDPIAFRVGPLAVHWYGLAYVAGFVVAWALMRGLVRRWDLRLSDDDLMEVILWSVGGVLVGGRLGYVLFYGDGYYFTHPAQAFAIWDGGMSFHGGLIGILVAGALVARRLNVPWLTLGDLGAVGAPVGFFLGRLANFINGELWGRTTSMPWGVVFPDAGPLPRHPSQLYEAGLEGAALFVLLFVLSRRIPPRPRGELLGWLLAGYGAARIFVEFFREPDRQLGFLFGGATMGQLLSVPVLLGGVFLVWWARRTGRPERGRSEDASVSLPH